MRSHFKPPAAMMRMVVEAGGVPALAREDGFRVWFVVIKSCTLSVTGDADER